MGKQNISLTVKTSPANVTKFYSANIKPVSKLWWIYP